MCGIAGIIGKSRIETRIETILNRTSHRGPDGLFYWQNEHIAFGHARLSIIDLSSNANQPMLDPETGNVIIFNGEIYNYLEIKQKLHAHYNFRTDSDTEVILAAYKYYGIEFLQYLRGMFAFALFDNTLKKVLLVRDRLGIKPIYYRKINDSFLFASEIKAIVNIEFVQEKINSVKAYEFLANRQLDCDHQTLFSEVFQIPPSHYIWVSSDGKPESQREYWAFPSIGERRFTEKEKKEFVDIFDETIRLHLRSDVPVGSFLSGGLDSSSVSCFALRNMEQENLHTFSAVLPYFHSENVLIDDVLKTSNKYLPHNYLLSGEDFFEDIPDVIFHHDEPIMDGSMYAHYKLCELARDNGIKVLLSGSGGDELLGGYGSHIYAHHAKLLSEFRLTDYFRDIQKVRKNSQESFKNLLYKSLYETLPVKLKRSLKNRQLRVRNKHLTIHPAISHYYFEHDNAYYANMINNYRSWTVPPYLHYEDRNSMAFGVEIRVPFFDHKLIEFIVDFSDDDIINGSSKSLMRKSFQGIVPNTVLNQKGKFGFPSPIDHALKTNKEGRELFFDLFRGTPLLEEKQAEKLAIDFYKGNGDLTTYWRTLSYILWYQIYFKNWKGYFSH